jgi:hypothetical protein
MLLKLKLYREMPKHGYKAQRLEPMPTTAAALAAAGVPRAAAAASA